MRRTRPSSPLTLMIAADADQLVRRSRIRQTKFLDTNRLQAEADADRERARDQGDLLEIDAELAPGAMATAVITPI